MISVCIATYNGSAYIEAQLTSILCQLADDDEVVVSDDGSDDGTPQIIDAMGDHRVRWAGRGGRLGVVKNFERALAAARGELIFLADQDDVWLPGKVAKCSEALRDNILVVTDCRVVDAQLHELAPSFFRLRKSGSGFLRNLYRNSYLGCCLAFRRELLSAALPIPAHAPMHDMWLGLLAETQGRTHFLREPLLLYRRHGGNASPTAERSPFSFGRQLQYRTVLLAAVLRRMLARFFALKG